jgi:hypothetical protein
MSPSFERALSALFTRVGGAVADSNDDLSVISSSQDAPPDFGGIMSQISDLQQTVALMEAHRAENARLRARVADLEQFIAQAAPAVAELRKRIFDIERDIVTVPVPTDWEHPGKIGNKTANSANFTSFSYSGQLTSTIVSGTPPMVIASNTKVANLNADLLDGTDWAAPGTIGGTTPASASFTSVNLSGQLTSTVATGTPPLVIASTTKIPNLNVDLLNGTTWTAPGPIGGTTPAAAVFTALTATGAVTCGTDTTTTNLLVRGASSGTSGGSAVYCRNGAATFIIAIGNKSAIVGGAYDATPYIYSNTSAVELSAGFKTNGNIGFFGTAPVAKPTVTGSRGGNAALASLLTGLAAYGLVLDSSTA